MTSTSLQPYEHDIGSNEEPLAEPPLIELYRNGGAQEVVGHKGFSIINQLNELYASYETTKKAMQTMHDAVMQNRHGEAFHHFCSACGISSAVTTIESLFNMDFGTCSLEQQYWDLVLDATGVKHFMPADRQSEWFESLRKWRKANRSNIGDFRPVTFTLENVYATAKTLIEEKKDYFSEMVLGVFENLSVFHKTNKSQCFSTKIIISNCLSSIDNSRHYSNLAYLNDLRKVIGLMHGRPGAENVNSNGLDEFLRNNTGEWVSVDAGALQCKGFINGNVHVLIEQNVVDDLNLILSMKLPDMIPHFKERGQSRHRAKASRVELNEKTVSFVTCGRLNEIANSYKYSMAKYKKPPFTIVLPYDLRKQQSCCSKELHEVLTMLGGEEVKNEVYHFDYWPLDAIRLIALHGKIPDQETHQLFQTPAGEMQKRAIDECHLTDGMKLLEPSIGFGALLRGVPFGVDVTGCEINTTAAMVSGLRWNVLNTDFLSETPKTLGMFDVCLCNPPFSQGRWLAHIQHAYSFVKPEGKIVAILPGSVTEEQLSNYLGKECDVNEVKKYENVFENTTVTVKLFTIELH